MFAPLLAFALVLAPTQDAPPPSAPVPPTAERYEQAMRCAGVMAAMSSLHAFTGDTEAKTRSDRNGRGFITAATGYAQPLGLTEQQLSEAFAASTGRALGAITRTPDQAAADAAVAGLNADHDACIALARSWVAEANGTS
ncbi:hypothetical protein GCM10007859_00170 [Brevundimonas denitrificans]|uniref:Uncharacterized protein n=1 Tax=Brevundimonas denitrificans TaxID=1443434 RepID=A0ABQ6BED2_9CAUL|nr:hypothetical protein [Brevundimonas denitrificans]GLS00014.1 hypothetical protein GCM10007859_00170 [Brevundimonas denitrificans]